MATTLLLWAVAVSKALSSSEVIKRLKEDGWELARSKGSHHHYKHPTKPGLVTVPHPRKTLKRGTQRSIFKQAGLKEDA